MESNRPELLGVPEAARAKGVHQETVRRAIRAGRLPALRIGRNFVIRLADLRAWRPYYEKAPGRQAAHLGPVAQSRAGTPPFHNLSVPPTPLLGRERELQTVGAYLAGGGKRLVTLTGPGGSGKTRLAMGATVQLVGAFEHGV